jgi:hypothetical protein
MVLTGNNSTTMSCISIDFHTEYSYVLPKLLKVGPVLITILVRVYVAMMKRLKKTDLKQLLKHSRRKEVDCILIFAFTKRNTPQQQKHVSPSSNKRRNSSVIYAKIFNGQSSQRCDTIRYDTVCS